MVSHLFVYFLLVNLLLVLVTGADISIEAMNIAGKQAAPLLDNTYLKLRTHVAQNAKAKRRPPSKITSTVSLRGSRN